MKEKKFLKQTPETNAQNKKGTEFLKQKPNKTIKHQTTHTHTQPHIQKKTNPKKKNEYLKLKLFDLSYG